MIEKVEQGMEIDFAIDEQTQLVAFSSETDEGIAHDIKINIGVGNHLVVTLRGDQEPLRNLAEFIFSTLAPIGYGMGKVLLDIEDVRKVLGCAGMSQTDMGSWIWEDLYIDHPAALLRVASAVHAAMPKKPDRPAAQLHNGE